MVVCPVCEHAQAVGPECEVCGRRLEDAPDVQPPVLAPMMEGLERTGQAPVPAVPGEPVPGIEPTRMAPVAAAAEPPIVDLESTRAAPVDPPVAPVEVERIGDGAPAEEPTPYPAVVLCRYCRTEAPLGARICERCGMRLPTAELPAPEPAPDAEPQLCSCGTPLRGSRCPSCGARVASSG